MYEEIDDKALVMAFFTPPYAAENRAKSPAWFLKKIDDAAIRILAAMAIAEARAAFPGEELTPGAFDMAGFIRAMEYLPEAEAEKIGTTLAQAIREAANG